MRAYDDDLVILRRRLLQHTVQTLEVSGGVSVHYQSWRPDEAQALRGVILLVHGAAEHGGRYEAFAAQCARSGFAVATVDLPGHGKSSGERCCVSSFDEYLRAVSLARKTAEEEFCSVTARNEHAPPESLDHTPFFLVGHSMGGLISALYIQDDTRFAGVVFSGAALAVEPQPPKLQLKLVRALARWFPALGVLKLDASGVSRDSEVVERYVNDPLVYTGKLPASLLVAMFAAMDRAVAGLGDVSTPVLVLHGDADKVVPPVASTLLHDRVGSQDKTLRLYPGLYHEIFNEPEREQVISDVINWVELHLPANA
ncbi:MAG: lysophospholipase [Gammaproteobacteria bacterium]